MQKKTESSHSELTSEASDTSEASRTSEARNNSWGYGGGGGAFAILTILEPQTPYFQLGKDEKMKFHQTKIFILRLMICIGRVLTKQWNGMNRQSRPNWLLKFIIIIFFF